jgi:hypothetical protein
MAASIFTDERVARDPFFFEPHIPSGSYGPVLFVRGFRYNTNKLLARRGVRDAGILFGTEGLERVAGG